MKYQSEIIKEIVDTRGHEKSSLHYESECIESWIEENKGAYPKLTDYQSEWLNYISEKPIGIFPYEIITDVTNATIDNVVPYAYKSAILKGQTLVNLLKQNEGKDRYIKREAISNGFKYTQIYNSTSMTSTRIEWDKQTGVNLFKASTKYYIQCDIKVNKPRILRAYSSGTGTKFIYELQENESAHIKGTFVTATEFDYIYLYVIPLQSLNLEDYTDDTFEISNLIIAEYQEGMENWDIPYFEGMQSVKMPVLTTTGKNIFPTNNFLEYGTNNQMVGRDTFEVYLKSGDYCSSYVHADDSDKDTVLRYKLLDEQNNQVLANSAVNRAFTIENDGLYKLQFGRGSIYNGLYTKIQIQLEKGSTATTYEPHKSNILTVNEDVELHGIGDVKDELNLLTGEVVQSVEVLNGEEVGWKLEGGTQSPTDSSLIAFSINLIKSPNKNLLSSVLEKSSDVNKPYRWYISFDTWLTITLPKSVVTNLDEFKAWLKNNETLYPLTEKSIKTVDLTITNQDGETLNNLKPIEGTMHLSTSSKTIEPLFSGEIPVEATTQNLSSFIKEE